MATQWNGDAFIHDLQKRGAQGLLAAAVLYENQLRLRVATPSPFRIGPRGGRIYYDPSKPGEYPKLRTGAGQKAITHQPETWQEVAKVEYVRVGYVLGDHHLLTLEMVKQRLGLLETLEIMRPQLAALATGSLKGL